MALFVELVTRGQPPIYVETNGNWPSWRYDGDWQNLMGMSWEYIDPPEELRKAFECIVKENW